MDNLEFCDKHNMVAYLQKSEGSEGFHQFIDFLAASYIKWTRKDYQASLRIHLKLEDSDGITTLPNTEIFEQLALMGYVTDSDKLTFQKGHFSPQWRFFIHTILHYLSPKKTAWEQFSSNIATAIICLATNRTFNFSKFIFDAMVKNLDSTHKFLMYPRFIQNSLNKQRRLLQPYTRIYIAHALTHKLFSNMKRASRGYSGEDFPLFPTMIIAPESSPSPSLSPQTHPYTLQPQTTSVAEEPALILSLNELTVLCTTLSKKVEHLQNDLKQTKLTYGAAYTKLILRVKKLEKQVKTSKARRRVKLVLSEDEDEDAEIQEKNSTDTEILLDVEEPTKLVEDQGSSEKEVNNVGEELSNVIPDVSIAAANLVYIRRSTEKRKDKGKTIMTELEPKQTTIKLKLRQERAGLEAAIRLQEHLNEEETKDDQSYDINWNDHSVIRFYAQQNRPFSKDEVRKNMCMYLKNQDRKGSNEGFDLQQDNSKRQKTGERSVSIEEPKDKELVEPSQKEIQEMMIILPEEGMHVEALQTKYPLIDWEIHSEDTMKFWKIIRVGNYTELWGLIKERFNTTEPIDDKERKLLVELKRLFKPDTDDLMELQSYMHDPLTWRLYDTCGVHHVSTKTGLDMFMLVEKDYPLTTRLPILMLVNKLQVDYDSEMENELLRKIFILANNPRQ
ncbi:hypothetical protein Tco_0966865 [Tanacetum coccineum]